jgi:hypothetical protein
MGFQLLILSHILLQIGFLAIPEQDFLFLFIGWLEHLELEVGLASYRGKDRHSNFAVAHYFINDYQFHFS